MPLVCNDGAIFSLRMIEYESYLQTRYAHLLLGAAPPQLTSGVRQPQSGPEPLYAVQRTPSGLTAYLPRRKRVSLADRQCNLHLSFSSSHLFMPWHVISW